MSMVRMMIPAATCLMLAACGGGTAAPTTTLNDWRTPGGSVTQPAMEYRIGARVVQRHDFIEGVRAVIVDKDHAPKWNPPTPEGVTETMLDAIFAPLPSAEEWSPLT